MSEELSKRIDDLEIELKQVGSLIAELLYNLARQPKPSLEPKKCPVCDGEGKRLYHSSSPVALIEECGSCEGKGVIWG